MTFSYYFNDERSRARTYIYTYTARRPRVRHNKTRKISYVLTRSIYIYICVFVCVCVCTVYVNITWTHMLHKWILVNVANHEGKTNTDRKPFEGGEEKKDCVVRTKKILRLNLFYTDDYFPPVTEYSTKADMSKTGVGENRCELFVLNVSANTVKARHF